MLLIGQRGLTIAASSSPHCLFVFSVECRAKVRDPEALVALPFTDAQSLNSSSMTFISLEYIALEYIDVVNSFREIAFPMTLHLKLFFWQGVLIGHFRYLPDKDEP